MSVASDHAKQVAVAKVVPTFILHGQTAAYVDDGGQLKLNAVGASVVPADALAFAAWLGATFSDNPTVIALLSNSEQAAKLIAQAAQGGGA